jgi:hypothetical protein
MGEADVRVLTHSVLPTVVMAAVAHPDKDAGSDGYLSSAVESVTDALHDYVASDDSNTEVLEEHPDVSEDEYEQELERTVKEAKQFDRVLVEDSQYGDTVASYLREHLSDVTVERYSTPEQDLLQTMAETHGAYADLPYTEQHDVMQRNMYSIIRSLRRKAEQEFNDATLFGKIGRLWARATESEDDYAVRSEHRSYKDIDLPTGSGARIHIGDTQDVDGYTGEGDDENVATVVTSAGKEWRKEYDEENDRVQVYENGIPKIDYTEDEEAVREQRENAINAFNAASQHALPEYTEREEEDYEGGIVDAVRDTVAAYVSKGRDKVEKYQKKSAKRDEYLELEDHEEGAGARLRRLKRKDNLTPEEQNELEELQQRRFNYTDQLAAIDEEYADSDNTDHVSRLQDGLKNSYESLSRTARETERTYLGHSPADSEAREQYKDLVDRVQTANNEGESTLIVASDMSQADVETILGSEGLEYDVKDALSG